MWELGEVKGKLEKEYKNLKQDKIDEYYEAFSKFDKEDEDTIPNDDLVALLNALE